MGEIARFSWGGPSIHGMERLADGDYVLYSGHEAEVARLRAEVEGLRKKLGEVTQCLADTVNEVGGWAVEEVIEAGMEAAMGASA